MRRCCSFFVWSSLVEQEYFTTSEAARYCAVNRWTLYKWKQSGLVPYLEIGEGTKRPGIRFWRHDLDRFMMARRIASRREVVDEILHGR